MPEILSYEVKYVEGLLDENERLKAAMNESYGPGCDCACCDIVREDIAREALND